MRVARYMKSHPGGVVMDVKRSRTHTASCLQILQLNLLANAEQDGHDQARALPPPPPLLLLLYMPLFRYVCQSTSRGSFGRVHQTTHQRGGPVLL